MIFIKTEIFTKIDQNYWKKRTLFKLYKFFVKITG